jgi:hypothetical protein
VAVGSCADASADILVSVGVGAEVWPFAGADPGVTIAGLSWGIAGAARGDWAMAMAGTVATKINCIALPKFNIQTIPIREGLMIFEVNLCPSYLVLARFEKKHSCNCWMLLLIIKSPEHDLH